MPKPREVTIEGHRIAALAFNEEMPGTPVIFLHGIVSSVSFWSMGQTPIFNQKFRWYSLSLPGHFPAAFPPGFRREDISSETLARVLTAAIGELVGEQPVILAGHSTGGFAALNIAAHAPELVQRVISVSGFARGKWTGALGFFQTLARMGAVGRVVFKLAFRILLGNRILFRLSPRSLITHPTSLKTYPGYSRHLDLLHHDLPRNDLDSLLHYFYRMPDIDIADLLPQIAAPMLVLAGDGDSIVPPEQALLIASKAPNSELAMMHGVGHLPMWENPTEYHRIITEWVQKTNGAVGKP